MQLNHKIVEADWHHYRLIFKETAITSRQSMNWKDTWFITLTDDRGHSSIGECGMFRGLSCDDVPDFQSRLDKTCHDLKAGIMPDLIDYPAILTGVEMALSSLDTGDRDIYFDSPWSRGDGTIKINGLVWMGTHDQMLSRINKKIEAGFRCIKIKVGAIDFEQELSLLKHIRSNFNDRLLTIRLDANGGFTPDNVMERLDRLAEFDIHSIEQPIKARQWDAMADVCRRSPIPVALDEELIGVNRRQEKIELLDTINPQYIILKPTLHGAFSGSDEWIDLAVERAIGWWATSALESNVGLSAIAQWTACHATEIPQGLGTGALYTNNLPSRVVQEHDYIRFS